MSDLEQTIEELEAEVLAELEEASEKPLGKAKDLGLGSDNAGDSVSTAKDPAANVAGADKAEKVEGEKDDLGGADPESKVEKGADEDRPEKKVGQKATAAAKEVSGDASKRVRSLLNQ